MIFTIVRTPWAFVVMLIFFSHMPLWAQNSPKSSSIDTLDTEERQLFEKCMEGNQRLEKYYTHVTMGATKKNDKETAPAPMPNIEYFANGIDHLRVDIDDGDGYFEKIFVTPKYNATFYSEGNDNKFSVFSTSDDLLEGISTINLSRFPFATFSFWVLPMRYCFVDRSLPHQSWSIVGISEKNNVGEKTVVWDVIRDGFPDWKGQITFLPDLGYAIKSYSITDTREIGQVFTFTCEYEGTDSVEGVNIPLIKKCHYIHRITGKNARVATDEEYTITKINHGDVSLDKFDSEKTLGIKIGSKQRIYIRSVIVFVVSIIIIVIWFMVRKNFNKS